MKPSALVLIFPVLCSAITSAQLPPQADTLFQYELTSDIDLRDSLIESTAQWKLYDVSYLSPRNGRVTGYLVCPADSGRHAAVLFGHWGPGNRTEFLSEAKLYAQVGIVSLMIDYPWVRPAPYRANRPLNFEEPQYDLQVLLQAVVDLRRGIDVLLSRADVDSERLGYVGHSYGAQWGAILSAIDNRIRAAVLVAGAPSDSIVWVESTDPELVAFRERVSAEVLQEYLRRVTAPLAAISYVPYAAPTPLFFQFALRERYFGVPAMNRYYGAASEPKEVRWYDTGHELNDPQALIDRAEWLTRQLRARSVKPIFESMLK